MRKFATMVLLGSLAATGVHAQTITFSNASPDAVVKLESGSQVSIDANGNLIARCDASDPAGCARLLQTGGGGQCGTGVTFTSPLSVITPATPPAPGPYPGGSQLTVRAQMTGAAVCIPSAERVQPAPPTPISITGWTNPLTPAGSTVTQNITLPTQPETTYALRLTCYGSTGSVTSERTVTTSAQVTPPPSQCPSQFPTNSAYTSATAGATAPTPIDGVTLNNINGFEQLINVLGFNVNPFPRTGTTGNQLGPWDSIRVIRFTVPNPFPPETFSRLFQFISWPNGFIGGQNAYISVSSCPGDLRIPTALQSGTADDPTYAESCRNWRGASWTFEQTGQSDIPYVVGVPGQANLSTPTQCILEPGRTYYMNIYMNRPQPNRSLVPTQPVCRDAGNNLFDCGLGISAGA